jgi:glycosyltransferase involved in cell wall biosynthesis
MSQFTRLVFWQNMPSHHQSGVLLALARDFGFEVVWVVQEGLTGERAEMGWPEFEGEGVEFVVAPDEAQIKTLMGDRVKQSLHFVGGIFSVPVARKVFFGGVLRGLNYVFMNEAPLPKEVDLIGKSDMSRRIGNLQPHFQRIVRWLFGGRVRAVLCIGTMAERAYCDFGWGKKVFQYGYFPAGPGEGFEAQIPEGDFRITYLGQFTHRKGTDVLVRALSEVVADGWRADFYGDGEQRGECEQLIRELSFEGEVAVHGYLKWEEAMQVVAASDVVVVPSRHDGWGALVGEALMRGVPVVATDQTGSSALLGAFWRGHVVPAGDVDGLRKGLEDVLEMGRLSVAQRERLVKWGRLIEPESAAKYLSKVVRWIEGGQRPAAPWIE